MRPRASWTAKTAALTLTAGLVATASGPPGVALAASGSPALTARGGAAGTGQVAGQAALAGDVCGDAGALLGIVGAACRNAALVGSPAAAPIQAGQSAGGAGRAAASQGSGPGTGRGPSQGAAPGTAPGTTKNLGTTVGQVVQRAVAPITAVLGPGGPVPVLKTVPALAPVTAVTGALSWSRVAGAAGPAAPGTDRAPGNAPATHAGDTNVPAATQLAGLGALPGLADLPSAGPASAPARHGAQGGGIPMPGTALSAASSGMSSGSFAALVVGALLAGVSALKIAGRRARDRKAGIGAVL
jgi:hypothetical protein